MPRARKVNLTDAKQIKGIEDLQPHPENPNSGTERGVATIERSIGKYGPGRSGVCDANGVMVAGSHTLEAIANANIPIKVVQTSGDEWLVVQRVDWDVTRDQEAREYAYVDNLAAVQGNAVNYQQFVQDSENGVVDLTGFLSPQEIEHWLSLATQQPNESEQQGDLDSDKAAAEKLAERAGKGQITPTCKAGEIYVLGQHRLAVGDFRDRKLMERLLDTGNADMIFTDPPFNTGIQQGRTSSNWGVIENDAMDAGDFAKFVKSIHEAIALYSKPNAHIYLCCDWKSYPVFIAGQKQPNACIIWVKNNFGLGTGYRPQHEFIVFWGKLDSTTESNVWEIAKDHGGDYKHPTQKPVPLIERALTNSAESGHVVLDFFGGSGSTLIACHSTGCICRTVEIDPVWATVILERFRQFTGLEPELL